MLASTLKNFSKMTQKSSRSFGIWGHVAGCPPDSILGLLQVYRNDPASLKVNLTAGAYRCENGKPWILPSVKLAIEQFNNSDYNLEYVPINGHRPFINAALDLAYGEGHPLLKAGNVASVQTMSGCGALYIGMQFLKEHGVSKQVWASDPTWPIQKTMAQYLGLDQRDYPYYDKKTVSVDYDKVLDVLDTKIEEGALVILHACSHNPTGFDPSVEQWKQMADIAKRRKWIPYFDMAYQGFATGDLSADNFAVRQFADAGLPIMVGTSFAKNMGLYGTRTGTLSIVCEDSSEATKVQSQMEKVGRNCWSSCPLHGAQIAERVLKTPEIRKVWDQDLITMSSRIRAMRELFVKKLAEKGSTHNWDHILTQIGMFAFTGVGPKQCQELMDKHHVYLTMNGRVSIAGLNPGNIDYTAECFHDVTKNGRD